MFLMFNIYYLYLLYIYYTYLLLLFILLYLLYILLFIHKSDLEAHFKAAGKIDRIVMRTEGGFESAIVTFDSIDAMNVYHNTLWMEFIQGHAIKVMPANLTREDRELRNRYVVILSGFAPNILGQDLIP